LADHRLEFLARETDRSRKPGIYEFPREFKRIRGALVQFLVEVFRPNPLQPNPRLEGFYFTGIRKVAASAASPGSAPDLDRTMVHKVGDVTRIFRAEDLQKLRAQAAPAGQREPEVTRWSFVVELWQQIVHSGKATVIFSNLQQEAWRKVAFIGVTAVCGLAAILFINSSLQNRSLLHRVRAAALECESVPAGSSASLVNLRAIDNFRGRIEDLESGPSLFLRFGFYEVDRVKNAAVHLYFARLRQYFLDQIVQRLESDLASLPGDASPLHSYDMEYAALKTYRTITKSPAEASCAPDSALPGKLLALWQQDRPADPEAEKIARADFQFYVDNLKARRIPEDLEIVSKDAPVVTRWRQYLSSFRGVEPQYQRIVEQVNREMGHPASVDELLRDPKARLVLHAPEVPAAFTREGWDHVQKLIEDASKADSHDSCVLGSGGSRLPNFVAGANTKDQLRDMYVKDYIQRWQQFLSQTSVIASTGCGDSAAKLGVLNANTSPVLAALVLAAKNTKFPKHAPSLMDQARPVVNTKKPGFLEPFRKGKDQKGAAPTVGAGASGGNLTEDDITNGFQPVHAVFKTSPPNLGHWNDETNTPYLDGLVNLQGAMGALDKDGKCNYDLGVNAQANDLAGKALIVVTQLTRRFDTTGADGSVRTLLESPITDAKRWINIDRGKEAKSRIDAAQKALCNLFSPLTRKYPFNRKAEEDASFDDITKLFSPQNSAFTALKMALGENITKSGNSWTPKPDATIKLSATFLTFFNRASAISDALFQSGSLGMRYKLKMSPNPTVKEIQGSIDGQPISTTETEYSWLFSNPKIELRVIQSEGGSSPLRGFSDPWATFRLLSGADGVVGREFYLTNVQCTGCNTLAILPDKSSIVLVLTQGPNDINPFDPGFFQLTCPTRATE
jgi:type VI secretion system protein ImpL